MGLPYTASEEESNSRIDDNAVAKFLGLQQLQARPANPTMQRGERLLKHLG
jgi:hypothetical protein